MKTGTRLKSKKQHRMDVELLQIIDDMDRAMWNADKAYIANANGDSPLTINMNYALCKFQDYCARYYGKKTIQSEK